MLRRIPKWLYVVLAVACFVGFHQFAKILQNGQGTGGIGFMAAHWAQYIFPGVLLLAALLLGRGDVEKTKAGRRSGAVQRLSVAYGTAAENSVIKVDPFRRMSQEAFQELITEFFVKNGFAGRIPGDCAVCLFLCNYVNCRQLFNGRFGKCFNRCFEEA